MRWRWRDLIASWTVSLDVVSAKWLPSTILCQWIEKNEVFLVHKVALTSCPEHNSVFLLYCCFQSKLGIFADSSLSLCYPSPQTWGADAYSCLTNSFLFSLPVTKIFRSLWVSAFQYCESVHSFYYASLVSYFLIALILFCGGVEICSLSHLCHLVSPYPYVFLFHLLLTYYFKHVILHLVFFA